MADSPNRAARRAEKFRLVKADAAIAEQARNESALLASLLDIRSLQQGHRVNVAVTDDEARQVTKFAERRLINLHHTGFLDVPGSGPRYAVRISKP